jgi:hypothetical protein
MACGTSRKRWLRSLAAGDLQFSDRSENWKHPVKGRHVVQSLPPYLQIIRELDDYLQGMEDS